MTALRGYEPPPRNLESVAAPETTFALRMLDVATEGDRVYLDTISSISRYSARDSWKFYEQIGEVHYGVSRSAKIAGYGKIIPQYINRSGIVEDKPSISTVDEIVAGIYGKFGGVRGLIERYYTLMKVPAEGYLVRVVENGTPDGYWVLSPDEIEGALTTSGKVDASKPVRWKTALTTGRNGETSQFVRDIQPKDFIGRVWNPSHRYVDMVDSAMAALKLECEELIMLTQAIKGRLQQRFALAGILLIPNEINDANIAGAKPRDPAHADKVLNYLITLMTRNVQNHDEAIAHIPALLKGPADALDKVRHLMLDTMVSEQDIHQRAELIDRILTGLDVQKAQVKSGEGQSHWGAWAGAEEERRIAVQPDTDTLAHILTKAILHPALIEKGWQPEKVLRWRLAIDLSGAAVKTNQEENFRLGWDRGWTSEEAGRRVIGADDTDAMTPEEKVRWTGIKISDPYLALYGIDGKDGIAVDWDKVGASKAKTGPDAQPDDSSGRVGPGVGSPGSPNSRDSDTPKSQEPSR